MRIGELANATETNVETVRHYEKIGILPKPARTSANYRSYGLDHLVRLTFIRRARYLGFSLEVVRELLKLAGDEQQSCEAIAALSLAQVAQIEMKIEDLRALKSELSRIAVSCQQGTVADCKIIETLSRSA